VALVDFEQIQAAIINYFRNESWVIQVFIIVFVTLLISFLQKRLLKKIDKRLEKTRTYWDDALIKAMQRPLTFLIWIIGLAFAADIVQQETHAFIFSAIDPIRDVGVIVTFVWFLVRFISGVLAFGGIGGIAIGFAAKDLLANFFGGLMIYMDRPFNVGDWIRSPDREIEGTVENIGWRLTRIRTFDKRPLYVPNAVFTSVAVENPSRMTNRRIKETIGIRYDDASKMKDIITDVKAMLKEHEEIDTGKTLIVNLNEFAPSSLDFFIYTFTKTTDWIRFHEIKQDVMLKILDIIEAQNSRYH
jgi:MscS family membrane protein